MADIRHRAGIVAPRTCVYEALSTTEGLSGWWTRHIEGDSAVGGSLRFFFGSPEPSAVMEVTELTPDVRVIWRCTEGPHEWVGTTFAFDLSESGGETTVTLEAAGATVKLTVVHDGFDPDSGMPESVSGGWPVVRSKLKTLLESGQVPA
jgi:uncharacterized protein YndB with AHSA1/START domain